MLFYLNILYRPGILVSSKVKRYTYMHYNCSDWKTITAVLAYTGITIDIKMGILAVSGR